MILFSRIRQAKIALLAALAIAESAPADLIDPCDSLEHWSAHPAEGVALELSIDAGALRMDFAIPGAGYAVARLETRRLLPANYAIREPPGDNFALQSR